VSRESIIIPVKHRLDMYRRLTLRERACLQGFPITFQFYGANYVQKLRMIGNAVPPAFSYFVGHALQEHGVELVPELLEAAAGLTRTTPPPAETPPDRVGAKYPADRRFRFAVPSLQLKSGVRFELRNDHSKGAVRWSVAFYFGTSKAIQSIELDACLASELHMAMSPQLRAIVANHLQNAATYVAAADIANMQVLWAHQGPGGTRAFMLLDKLDEFGSALSDAIRGYEEESRRLIDVALHRKFGGRRKGVVGIAKLHRNAAVILAGLLIGSSVNPFMEGNWGADRTFGRARLA
jgi:DNA (cytosine-5)-methyltransferase 1